MTLNCQTRSGVGSKGEMPIVRVRDECAANDRRNLRTCRSGLSSRKIIDLVYMLHSVTVALFESFTWMPITFRF